jgi:hypothetical protein
VSISEITPGRNVENIYDQACGKEKGEIPYENEAKSIILSSAPLRLPWRQAHVGRRSQTLNVLRSWAVKLGLAKGKRLVKAVKRKVMVL